MDERDQTTDPQPPEPAGVTRRDFVRGTIAGAGLMIVPRHVLGQGMTPPSDTVNIAVVGINGQGGVNAQAVMSQNIVAICDVDDALVDAKLASWKKNLDSPPPRRRPATPKPSAWHDFGPSKAQVAADAKWTPDPADTLMHRFLEEQVPKLTRYRDYREMLDKQKDLDAVIVATPDHMHAVIATAAMDAGKHVYVQKPLCWSVEEARQLAKKAAANPKLVTQMGNQGHSGDGARRGQEYLMAHAIGDIREVHVWTNRPLGYWPQGVPRPAPLLEDPNVLRWNSDSVSNRLAAAMYANYPLSPTLSWDLFLGGAPDVTYHPVYHPFNWRGWVDWGQGALGDMGAHLIDHPVWGLDLGYPSTIETLSTPFNGVTYPVGSTTYYEFPARSGRPAVSLSWCDGGLLPQRPEELGEEKMNADGGVLYVGSHGKLLQDTYGEKPRLLPAELHNSYGPPPERLPRVPHGAHEMNWVNAIRGRDEISCPFSYASHLTEIMLLGIVSLRAGTKIAYDGEAMRVTNAPEANDFLRRVYQHGFGLS